jgi:hypothetical protein
MVLGNGISFRRGGGAKGPFRLTYRFRVPQGPSRRGAPQADDPAGRQSQKMALKLAAKGSQMAFENASSVRYLIIS